jgi:hypothetical protein
LSGLSQGVYLLLAMLIARLETTSTGNVAVYYAWRADNLPSSFQRGVEGILYQRLFQEGSFVE